MHIKIRATDQATSLQEYRAAQGCAWLLRNQKQLRADFWARKGRMGVAATIAAA